MLSVVLGPGGVLVGIHGPAGLTGLLEYDPGDGHLMARQDVPPQAGEWLVAGYHNPDGIVLTRRGPDDTDVVLLDPVTGTSRVVLTVPGLTAIRLASSGG